MIPSKYYSKMFKKARAFMTKLGADDKRFHRTVIVHHQDGSTFILTHAFIAFDEKETFCVIPEHHDVHVFHKEDLHDWIELEQAKAINWGKTNNVCPVCEGNGTLVAGSGNPQRPIKMVKCEHCDGSGKKKKTKREG